jgi:hypothetical protein
MRRASDIVLLWTLPIVITVCGLLTALVVGAAIAQC